MREAIEAWREFYAAVANAGAALLGLVFVGVSIHLSGRRLGRGTRLLGMEAAANLLHPLLLALVMLLPVEPVVQGISLLGLSVLGLPGIAYVAWKQTRLPYVEGSWMRTYRYAVPLLATVLGSIAAIGLVVGWPFAVYGPAVYVFLMFIVGTQNAWDLLLGTSTHAGPWPSPPERVTDGRIDAAGKGPRRRTRHSSRTARQWTGPSADLPGAAAPLGSNRPLMVRAHANGSAR